jgi:hypothetical protein
MMEDGVPRRQPLFRAQSAHQVHRLDNNKSSVRYAPTSSNSVVHRSYDDLRMNSIKPSIDLAMPACNSTMKIIDQMDNLKFESFDPILTSTHKDRIIERVRRTNVPMNYVVHYSSFINLGE